MSERGVIRMSKYLSGLSGKRKKIAEELLNDIRGSQIKSSTLYEVLKNELNNISDAAIDIRFRKNQQVD